VSFAENENVIQTLAPDRTDEALGERILPGAVRRREDFGDPHALHSVPKLLAVDLVTVAQEIGRRGVVRESVHDLLGGPVGGGVLGHVGTRRVADAGQGSRSRAGRWPPQKNGSSRSRWSRRVTIEPGLCQDQSRQINDLPGGRGFGEGQQVRSNTPTRCDPISPYSLWIGCYGKQNIRFIVRIIRGYSKHRVNDAIETLHGLIITQE